MRSMYATPRRPRLRLVQSHTMDDESLITRWITHLQARGLAERTVKIRAYYVRRTADHKPLREITLDDLEQILATSDYAAETKKSIRASWRDFFAWAYRQGHLPDDPAYELAPIRIPVTVPHLAPDDEIARSLINAPARERAMILLGRLACLRLTEITTLHSDDWRGDWLHITGKGDKQRRVFVVPELAAALRAQLEEVGPGGYFFPGLSGPHMHPQSVCKLIRAWCGHNPHSLRHAGATAAYRSTRDLRAVQLMLGHSSMAVTQRYLHCHDDSLQAVALGATLRAA